MTVRSSVNNSYSHTSLFDVQTNALVRNVSTIPENSMVLDSKDGLVFASDANGLVNDGWVNVYNSTTLTLLKKIQVGIEPSSPIYDNDTGMIYVGTYGFRGSATIATQDIQAINPATLSVAKNISTGYFLRYLAYSPATHFIYAGDDGSLCGFCTLSNTTIVNPVTGRVVTVIPNLFGQMTYSPQSKDIYLLNYSETGPVQQLVVLNTSNSIAESYPLSNNPKVSFNTLVALTSQPYVFISSATTNETGAPISSAVSVFNTETNSISETITLPDGSLFLSQAFANDFLYVSADTTPLATFQANGAVFVYKIAG